MWMTDKFLGLQIWLWLMLLFCVLSTIYFIIYVNRNRIKKVYWQFRKPERLIKVVIHYPRNDYKEFWRLIPEDERFKIGSGTYYYSDSSVIRDNEFFAYKKNQKNLIKVDGKEYELSDIFNIKRVKSKFPEIHYYFNNPTPLSFSNPLDPKESNAKEARNIEENQLFEKLLALRTEITLLVIILVILCLVFVVCLCIFAVQNGWISFNKGG